MLQIKQEDTNIFVSYIEKAVSELARKNYSAFLKMFDSSRLSEKDVIFALKFLDMDYPITEIDNPLEVKCEKRSIYAGKFSDGSGYYIDYDLSTDGELNDLTLSCEFLKSEGGYRVVLSDLHTM